MSARIIVVSGLSGSGKTTALRALEDLSFFCIDNLPPAFLRQVVRMAEDSGGEIQKVAFGVDIRSRSSLEQYPEVFDQLAADGADLFVLFLDCNDEVLLRRFKETRRPHPAGGEGGDTDLGIAVEREKLADLKSRADLVLDTSRQTVHELTRLVKEAVSGGEAQRRLGITVLSFGFRNGVPHDADLVFDVRFLPNPYFDPGLKRRDGRDQAVAEFALDNDVGRPFFERLYGLLEFLLPCYEREGKSTLVVACGCTGGHHRSVATGERLAAHLRELGYVVALRHRDVGQGGGG